METVKDILENTRVNGDYHTHVSMIQPLGKFQINKHQMNNFWDKYSTSIIEEPSVHYGLAEKPQSYLPVIADIDLKIKFTDANDLEKLYTKYQIESVVRDYQETIRNILAKPEPKHLICFVMEKDAYKITSGDTVYIKHGLHISFPYTFMSKVEHEVHLIPRLQKLFRRNNTFKDLGYEDSSTVIDTCYTRNPWLLYGSKKAVNMQAYKVSTIYNEERDIISLETAMKWCKIYDENENLIVMNPERYEYYLPRLLSIVVWHREVADIKSGMPNLIQINPKQKDKKREYKILDLSDSLIKCKKLLSIISDDRTNCYSDWMNIGWALYNVSEGSNEGLGLWVDFSSRCEEKFDEDSCISIWEGMEKRNMTIGTLAHFAKMDNPIAYNKYIDENLNEGDKLKHIIQGQSHYDIAKACREIYGTEFVCASVVQNLWFQFEKHHWRKVEEGVFLRKKLSEEFANKIENKKSEMHANAAACGNEGEKMMYVLDQQKADKLIGNLKNSSFKNNVMKEMKEVFYDEQFSNCLNKNAWLIGMRNGVYDLKNNVFRAGVPEDFISLQMPIEYSEYDEGHKLVKEVYDFLEKIFPDKELRDYFMDISSDIFVGGNQKKLVFFWSGEGNNGKSVTQTFFEKMLGEYSVKLPTSLITGKRTQSSGAAPEIVRAAGGVRWAVLQEPSKGDVINIGLLKELSGNDTMYARALFKEGADLELMIKLCVICNDPPVIPHDDPAAWARIRVIPFESSFCDDAPDTWEEQLRQKRFPKDPYFSEKIPNLVKPLMWILLNHRKKGGAKYIEPKKVTCATNLYRKRNDVYKQFEDERVIQDPKGKISLSELWLSYKEWHRDSVPGKELPGKEDVKEHFIKRWGEPCKGSIWKGRKGLTIDDEIAAGTTIVLGQEDLVQDALPQDSSTSTCSSKD